jgi:hypothetical protein
LLCRLLCPFHNGRRFRCHNLILIELFVSLIVNGRPQADVNGKPLARMSLVNPADRSHISIIAAISNAHVL